MSKNESSGESNFSLIDINQIIHAPARLNILASLYVVTSLDYVFLKKQTGLSWGNLATHLKKLEEASYISVHKGYQGKKPQSTIKLTLEGRKAFKEYKLTLQQVLNDLPD